MHVIFKFHIKVRYEDKRYVCQMTSTDTLFVNFWNSSYSNLRQVKFFNLNTFTIEAIPYLKFLNISFLLTLKQWSNEHLPQPRCAWIVNNPLHEEFWMLHNLFDFLGLGITSDCHKTNYIKVIGHRSFHSLVVESPNVVCQW